MRPLPVGKHLLVVPAGRAKNRKPLRGAAGVAATERAVVGGVGRRFAGRLLASTVRQVRATAHVGATPAVRARAKSFAARL